MIGADNLLVSLVRCVDRLPMPVAPARRGRGRPPVYPQQLILKALVVMIIGFLRTKERNTT